MVLGNRLRHLRESKGLSHRELGKLTGDSSSFLMRVESGHAIPSMETIERWAKALGVSVDLLFYDGGQPALPNLPNRLRAEDIAAPSLRKAHDIPGKMD
jgi:transcriptional regulator with XRE-family HTH domain